MYITQVCKLTRVTELQVTRTLAWHVQVQWEVTVSCSHACAYWTVDIMISVEGSLGIMLGILIGHNGRDSRGEACERPRISVGVPAGRASGRACDQVGGG